MYYKFKHLIYPVNGTCKMVVQTVFPVKVDENTHYTISITPFSGLRVYGLRGKAGAPTFADSQFFAKSHTLKVCGEHLEMDVTFPQEDCYYCKLCADGEVVQTLELYALEEDLYSLTPYRGDNHMHSWMSDGKDSPMYMAAAVCRLGCDYCVITDHGRYKPSLVARDFYKDTGVDFLVIPGEEVHSPDNPVHLINLGGNEGVNDWWRDHEEEYRAAVSKELEKITEPMLEEDRYAAAASQVMFDKIHSVDGIAVLCHPHWVVLGTYNEREDVTQYLCEHRRFDALELIAGGAHELGTQLQLSYFRDRETMPVLGSSDAHACFADGWDLGEYTIVFADGLDTESVKNAIRKGNTVAGNEDRLYGSYRLVRYGYFLQRCYYPMHKKQRDCLGEWMLRLASSRLGPDSEIWQMLSSTRPSELFAQLRYDEE